MTPAHPASKKRSIYEPLPSGRQESYGLVEEARIRQAGASTYGVPVVSALVYVLTLGAIVLILLLML